MKNTLLLYVSTLFRFAKWKIIIALSLMVILSLVEGVGLLMIIPLLKLIGIESNNANAGAVGKLIFSIFQYINIKPTFFTVLLFYVIIVSFYGFLQRFQTNINSSIHYGFITQIRQLLYNSISKVNWTFFVKNSYSKSLHALTNEIDRVGTATYHIIRLFASLIVTVVYFILSVFISPILSGIVVISATIIGVILKGKMNISRDTGKNLSKTIRNLYSIIGNHLNGMKAAKTYGAEEQYIKNFDNITDEVYRLYIKTVKNQAEIKHYFEIATVVVLSGILYISVEILKMEVSQLILIILIFARLMPKFSEIMQSYNHFIHLLPSFSNIMKIQDEYKKEEEIKPKTTKTIIFNKYIQLRNITFGYNGEKIIHNINITIKFGEVLAIAGPSGAGKSTIIDIIIGLLSPQNGEVIIDGEELTPDNKLSWKKQIGYVGQDIFLLNDTIRKNILFANPNATENDIYKALESAGAKDFVLRLPDGLDTIIGERGFTLSGGERQRIELTKAFVRNPSLFIFDEATNSLDGKSEKIIKDAIRKIKGEKTVIIVSHRVSTITDADRILVVEQGKIVEEGTHKDLLKRNGIYCKYYNL